MRKNQTKRTPLRDDQSLGLLLAAWLFRILLVLVMMAGICKLSALPIKPMTAECLPTITGYTLLLTVLHSIYHACDVGQARVSELVMSQILADVISAGAVYLSMALYTRYMFDPTKLLIVVGAQILLGIAWSIICNSLYFKRRRKPYTVVICRTEADYTLLSQSPYFFEKYDVIKVIREEEGITAELQTQLEGCEVVFAVNTSADCAESLAKICLEMGIKGCFSPSLGQIIVSGAQHRANYSLPMLRVERAGKHSEFRFFKRAFDMVSAVLGLIILSPVMLITSIAIWAEDHGPVFYRQNRLTKNGREFSILKFRSMTVNAEKDGVARLAGQNDSRITRVGRVIRACRIDELPQLINILKGDMSIVGPRPERPEIAKQYEAELPEFALRLQVKAGLTGLAQVYGRYNTEPYHKLQMDLMYINDMSLLKDLQLILATIKILFVKESTQGVAQGQDTALGKQSKST